MPRRLLREEGGFTLTEMLVTMMVMLTVMFALYSIFDMSIRVFAYGNDKVEAVENARLGLDKMARELRGAYPADRVHGNTNLFWTAGAPGTALTAPPPATGPITFGNDRNGNRRIYDATTTVVPPPLDSGEQITYSLSDSTLQRNGDPVAENVKDVDGDGQALTFTYLNENGVAVDAVTGASAIRTVRIKLEVKVDRGVGQPAEQTLQTDVTLRNRSG
jgi:prepilin-type N-terminal cleavage/methylation domain-containing protein